MSDSTWIPKTAEWVRDQMEKEGSHDWWHVYRVWQMARHLAEGEEVDQTVVELGALLHDIADHKFHAGDTSVGPRVAAGWLEKIEVPEIIIEHVQQIIREVSFKGANVPDHVTSPETMIVQDADRLDALGAIGIARTFAYGGSKGRLLYDPDEPPVLHDNFTAYKSSTAPTINHFYEKLLLLKDRMHTEKAKAIAGQRHRFMEEYLERFYREWEGEE